MTRKNFVVRPDVADAVQTIAEQANGTWTGTAESLLASHPRVRKIMRERAAAESGAAA